MFILVYCSSSMVGILYIHAVHQWSAYCISTVLVGKLYMHICWSANCICTYVFQRRVTLKARACGDQILSRMALVYCRRWVQFLNFSIHCMSMHGVPFTQNINCQVGLTNEKLSLRRLCVFRIWMFGSTCSRYYACTPIKDYSICVSTPLHTC